MIGFVLLSLLFTFVKGNDSLCLNSCNAEYGGDDTMSVCSAQDGLTTLSMSVSKTSPRLVHKNAKCFLRCGVGMLYVGECGCPSNCMSHAGRGVCVSNAGVKSCRCHPTWAGTDCSSVRCPANNCSGHGVCAVDADVCNCNSGYTGYDCSSALASPRLQQAPWGTMCTASAQGIEGYGCDGSSALSNRSEYTVNDKFKDHHPVFTFDTVAMINITVDDLELRQSLQPANLYNSSKMNGTMDFYSTTPLSVEGNDAPAKRVSVKHLPITFATKGAGSRRDLKNGWKIKVVSKDDAVEKFFGVRHLGLKAGDPSADGLLRPFLASTLLRYTGTPVGRQGYTTLFVNSVFFGVFFYDEYIPSDHFIESRILDASTSETKAKGTLTESTLMKLGAGAHLQYLGNHSLNYSSVVEEMLYAEIPVFVRKALGDASRKGREAVWLNPYISLIRSLGSPDIGGELEPWSCRSPEERSRIPIDVRSFFAAVAVEAILESDDNFVAANNYVLVQVGATGKWMLIDHDFDRMFQWEQAESGENSTVLISCWNVTEFPTKLEHIKTWNHSNHNFALQRLFNRSYLSKYGQEAKSDGTCMDQYLELVRNVALAATGRPSSSPKRALSELLQQLASQLAPILTNDPTVTFYLQNDAFESYARLTAAAVDRRLKNVSDQFLTVSSVSSGPKSNLLPVLVPIVVAFLIGCAGIVFVVKRRSKRRRALQESLVESNGNDYEDTF